MSKIAGVIFDWAGTTIDFGCFAPVHVFLEIFKTAGVEVTIEEARGPMGMLKRDHIEAMLKMPRIKKVWQEKYGREFGEEDIDFLYADFLPLLLNSLSQYTDPLPEVVETVTMLRGKGLKIGSTTGYTDEMMKIVLQGAQKKGYQPDFWITPDTTGFYGRPYPYMIFRNMEALRITAPWQIIKVGDTVADIQEGTNAGVWSVGVIVGSSQMGLTYDEYFNLSVIERNKVIRTTEEGFLAAGADFTIRTMKELPALIESINYFITTGRKPNGSCP